MATSMGNRSLGRGTNARAESLSLVLSVSKLCLRTCVLCSLGSFILDSRNSPRERGSG